MTPVRSAIGTGSGVAAGARGEDRSSLAGGCQRPADPMQKKRNDDGRDARSRRAASGTRASSTRCASVPRHLFVPPAEAASAYDDRPLPIGSGQTISQPYVVAFMTEQLRLTGKEKVLEIGTGSGYSDGDPRRARREGLLDRDPARARGRGDGAAQEARHHERRGARGRRLPRLARGGAVRRHPRHGGAGADPAAAPRAARVDGADGHSRGRASTRS